MAPYLSNTYWHWEKALSKDFCNLVIQEADWSKKQQGVAGGVVDEKARITDVVWMNRMSPISCVALNYINSANVQSNWNFELINIEEVQIGRYEKNGHYDWHTDDDIDMVNGPNTVRKISLSIQLNDPNEYEGGALEFKNKGHTLPLKMQQGDVVVFPSFIEHRITPILSGIRYSAVAWAHGPFFK